MAPIRLTYNATPLRLAASLGSETARDQLPRKELEDLDDAFAVLMSCSDVAGADGNADFGPPRLWPYTLEAALRMALAAYREFLPDWAACFEQERDIIPENVPEEFARQLVNRVTSWVTQPDSFSWDRWHELYSVIKDDICLDGYLTNKYPRTPSVIAAFCYGSLYLIDIENCQPDAGPTLQEYNPNGIYAARTNDAIGNLLSVGLDETRIRHAIQREVIPWCLGETDRLE